MIKTVVNMVTFTSPDGGAFQALPFNERRIALIIYATGGASPTIRFDRMPNANGDGFQIHSSPGFDHSLSLNINDIGTAASQAVNAFFEEAGEKIGFIEYLAAP